jgi:D-threo-aldose 1-dehydrogenase
VPCRNATGTSTCWRRRSAGCSSPGDDDQGVWAESSGLRSVFNYSYEATRRSLAESLQRLGLDRVDILHIHDPNAHYCEAIEGAFPALADLRAEGVIHAVSVGMNQSAMLADFTRAGDFDCFLLAGQYTLLGQSALTGFLPLCVERDTPVIAGAVLALGLLADPASGGGVEGPPGEAEARAKATAIREVCDRHGVPIAAAALQFPLGHPAVKTVLVGARSVAEIEQDVALFKTEIPRAFWADLRYTGLLSADVPTP